MDEQKIVITRPDDMHLHLRDGPMLETVLPYSSRDFGRAVVMPNLNPPITTIKLLKEYKYQITSAIPENHKFEPLMTLYLTDETKPKELKLGVDSGVLTAVKFYPAGATTNSARGVTNIDNCFSVFETMVELDLPLLIHGEVTDPEIDIFDRESIFISTILEPLRNRLPELRIALEHITTCDAVDYVNEADKNLGASITPHHLALNRNDIFTDGINPHNFCLPILKRERHRVKLVAAATSGSPKFFLGTDSAPHLSENKENACGCAGVFNSPNTLGVLASVFEQQDQLSNLEAFTSINGAKFYKLEANKEKIVMLKTKIPINEMRYIDVLSSRVKVFDPGFDVFWYVER